MLNWKSSWIVKLISMSGGLLLTFISGLYVFYPYYPYVNVTYGYGFPLAWLERYYFHLDPSMTWHYSFVWWGFFIDLFLYSLLVAAVTYVCSKFLRTTLVGRGLFLIKDKAQALRMLSVVACLLFLSSLFLPFLTAERGRIIREELDRTWFWSFKACSQHLYLYRVLDTTWIWFFHYWNGNYYVAEQRLVLLPTLPIVIFILQILTLAVATASVFARRLFLFCAVIQSLLIIILMILFGSGLLWFGYVYFEQFLAGFWLTIASFILFLASTILNYKWNYK